MKHFQALSIKLAIGHNKNFNYFVLCYYQRVEILLKMSVLFEIDQACDWNWLSVQLKINLRKHSPLYKKGIKENQNSAMETTGGPVVSQSIETYLR